MRLGARQLAPVIALLAVAACSDDASSISVQDVAADTVDERGPADVEEAGNVRGDAVEDSLDTMLTDPDPEFGDAAADLADLSDDRDGERLDLADDTGDQDHTPSDAGDRAPDDATDASDASDMVDVEDGSDAADLVDLPEETDLVDAEDTTDLGDTPDLADLGDTDVVFDASDLADSSDTADAPDDTSEPESCEVLGPRIESRRMEVAVCERSAQCAVRDNPLCPFGGCFTFFRTDAVLTGLDADELDYERQRCSILRCACPPEPPVTYCDEGVCGACPIACPFECELDCECARDGCGCDLPLCASGTPESCDAMEAALIELAADSAGCEADWDCVAIRSGLCDALPCLIAVHRRSAPPHLEALVASYVEAGCESTPACVCDDLPGPTCVEGRCQLP